MYKKTFGDSPINRPMRYKRTRTEVKNTINFYKDIFLTNKTAGGQKIPTQIKMAKKNPFESAKEVTTEFIKWEKETNPNIVGIYKADKEIDNKGEKFVVHQFEAVHDADTGELLGDLELPSMSMLKAKISGKMGKLLGISYQGIQPHPTKKGKTMNIVSVYLMS
jgi:hypothetical protein